MIRERGYLVDRRSSDSSWSFLVGLRALRWDIEATPEASIGQGLSLASGMIGLTSPHFLSRG